MKHRIDKILYPGQHFFILAAGFILSACIHINQRPFPDGWGTLPSIADNMCTDIDGAFSVLGESDTGKTPLPFAYIVMSIPEQKEWPLSKFDKTSYVIIEQAADVMRVSVLAQGKMIAKKELRKDERNGYSCTPQGISVRGEFPNVHGLAGYIGQTYMIFKASQGELIVKSEQTGGGLALMIPMYSSETFWYRYRPYHRPDS